MKVWIISRETELESRHSKFEIVEIFETEELAVPKLEKLIQQITSSDVCYWLESWDVVMEKEAKTNENC